MRILSPTRIPIALSASKWNYFKKAMLIRFSALLLIVLLSASTTSFCFAQLVVVDDDFESGAFSTDWVTTEGFSTAVLNNPGNGAGGSDYFSHIEGVTGFGSEAGLGVSLFNLDGGGTATKDFTINLDFRVAPTQANRRMFNLMINSGSNNPTPTGSAVNLRYYNDTWEAYNGSWQSIGLPAITANTWHNLSLSGSNWGSGIAGAATWDVELSGSGALNGLQIFQSDTDFDGARSVSLNDRWSGTGFDVDNVSITATPGAVPTNTVVITPTNPVAYSGIYPHTAVTNSHNESAVGALVNRNGKVWFVTYGPHVTSGGSDELYSVDTNSLVHTTWRDYPGNTDANRYTDTNLGIDVVGAAYIDSSETIRYLPVTSPGAGDLVGRITGTAAHLTDPNKLYYMTMEEGLYEVDFSNLSSPVITTLRADGNHDSQGGIQKNLPGVHGKGLFTGQGRLFYTNNGAGQGAKGGLVEWDGTGDPEQLSSWTVADDTAQYTEVTSRQGPIDMDPNSTDAIWATGWDDESLFINTRDATTEAWTKFRLPKSSYTHGHPNGWYTEWPRIRDVGLAGGYLMSHHGMMLLVPETFSADNHGGVTPLTSHHKMIVDYVEDGDQIVFAGNDSSRQLGNNILPKANSNIMFVDKDNLQNYGGKPRGFGGVWVDDNVSDTASSDAFLISGFTKRVIHLAHDNIGPASFRIEIDVDGTGNWTTYDTVSVEGTSAKGYGYYLIPETLNAEWIRLSNTSGSTVSSATAYLHVGNGDTPRNTAQLVSLADPMSPSNRSQGLLRSMSGSDFKLEFAADQLDSSGNIIGTGYYQAQLNETTAALELVAVTDATAEAAIRNNAATTQDYGVDNASAFIDDSGTRFRLPLGDSAFGSATDSGWRRGRREVVTERHLVNMHGTFYEQPQDFATGGIRRMLPITTHNLDIYDFMSWRGMLVLSGVVEGGASDGHYVESDDGNVGLWFGSVDDLWNFGAPSGVGGPWRETTILAGEASDPYLMAGYDEKVLQLSHDEPSSVDFTIEVDFLGTDDWHVYDTITVDSGEVLTHQFEDGYSAHWVRLISDTSTTATAWFVYGDNQSVLNADFDGDADVDGADFLRWQRGLGLSGQNDNANGDASGNGAVEGFDLSTWFSQYGKTVSGDVAGLVSPATVPEPSTLLITISAIIAVFCNSNTLHV